MWYEFFLIGSVPFWILCATLFLVIVAATEWENIFLSLFSVLISALLLWLCGDFNVFKAIWQHPGIAGIYLLCYLFVGMLWCIGKWYFFTRKCRTFFDKAKREFINSHHYDDGIPEAEKYNLSVYVQQQANRNDGCPTKHWREDFIPRASDHVPSIVSWIAHWPFSMLCSVFEDMVKNLSLAIYHGIAGLLQRIANRAFAGASDDFIPDPPHQAFRGRR